MSETAETVKKNKKINKMTLSEVEEALKKSQEHMKNLNSKYTKTLLARKTQLTGA